MPNVELISQTEKIEEYSMFGLHKNWHLIYLYSGELTVTLNDSVYNLRPNGVVLIAPEDFYYINQNNAYFTVLNFEINSHIDFNLNSKVFIIGDNEKELLNSFLLSVNPIERQSIFNLFLFLCGKHTEVQAELGNKKIRLYKKAVSLMERYITSSLTVDELAEMLNISLSMLKRIFAQFSSIGVHEYFLILKIKKAKELLLSGDSVTHTAKVLKFSSQAYFSAAFKRVTGISAKSYFTGKTQIKKSTRTKAKAIKQVRSDLPDYLL